jgi:outer membrane biosynthesis protein TonB
MRLFRRFSIGLTLGCFSLAFASQSALAQAAGAETAQPEVVLSKLVGPTYPPLARQARIQGDVKVA